MTFHLVICFHHTKTEGQGMKYDYKTQPSDATLLFSNRPNNLSTLHIMRLANKRRYGR